MGASCEEEEAGSRGKVTDDVEEGAYRKEVGGKVEEEDKNHREEVHHSEVVVDTWGSPWEEEVRILDVGSEGTREEVVALVGTQQRQLQQDHGEVEDRTHMEAEHVVQEEFRDAVAKQQQLQLVALRLVEEEEVREGVP